MSEFRRRLMMAQRQGDDVPSDYEQIDYIMNTGSSKAYIDTGFKPNNNTAVEFTAIPMNSDYIFGARTSAYEKNFGMYAQNVTNNQSINYHPRYDYGNKINYGVGIIPLGSIWNCYNVGNVMYIESEGNSHSITANDYTFQCVHNMYLFGTNNNGSPALTNDIAYIRYKIKDNGTLIRDYIPVKRKIDNIYGMWDAVENTFNTSPNSVLFEGGNFGDILLMYESGNSVDSNTNLPTIDDISQYLTMKRATLLELRRPDNAIKWTEGTLASINSNYTLMHKKSNNLTIAVNKSNYYVDINVIVRNGSIYTNPYSSSWTRPMLTADLSSYTGDEVWVMVNFKFNNAGTATAILRSADFTITWS